MSYYVIEYRYEEKLMHLVSDFRASHREYLRELEAAGILVTSGFLRDAVFQGALIILRADSAHDAEMMLADDPFNQNGLIHSVQVREWQPTVGVLAEGFDRVFPTS